MGPGYRNEATALLIRLLVARHGPITIARDEYERAVAGAAGGAFTVHMKLDPANDAVLIDVKPRSERGDLGDGESAN